MEKLVRLCKYLNSNKDLILVLENADLKVVKWYIDPAYAVNKDSWSYLGLVPKFDQCSTISVHLRKSKHNFFNFSRNYGRWWLHGNVFMNTKRVGSARVWLYRHILYQNNILAIFLDKNGEKLTLNIWMLGIFVAYVVEQGKLTIQYFRTLSIYANFMTKALQGTKLLGCRKKILGTQFSYGTCK